MVVQKKTAFFYSVMYILMLFCISPGFAIGQGFSVTNGRNHPELDWQTAETPHFTIVYPAHLAGIEVQAGAIAEASYEVLSENLNTTFDKKIRIYLSDEDEILNGFAITPFGFTNIWVHVNEVATTWSGNTKWLRTVLSHELAHLFHGKAIGGRKILRDNFLGDPMPGFWVEGLAQYQTELWDAFRGDQWLRTAILDDQVSYEDGKSIWNGRLLYASGNAQLRYLAEQYGDSTIAQILHHRKKTALGLIKHHDFYSAFEEVTGKSYRSFYDDWRRHMNVYYNTLAGQMENVDSLGTEPLGVPGQYIYDVRYSPDTTFAAVLSRTSIRRPVIRLHVIDREKKKSTIAAEGSIRTPISWSPDGNTIAFARRTRSGNGSLINDLFLVSRDGKKIRRLTKSRRALSPTFSPAGDKIAFIGSERGTANVFLLDLATLQETQLTSFQGDVQLASIQWHHESNKLVLGRFDLDGSRDVLILIPETRELTLLTKGTADEQFPVWSPRGNHVAITSLEDNVPNVFVLNVNDNTKRRVTNLVTGARVHDWLPPDSIHAAGTLIVSTSASKQRDRVYRIDAARIPHEEVIDVPASYSSWTRHRPPVEIPPTVTDAPELISKKGKYKSFNNLFHLLSFGLPYYNNADDWGVIGATSWAEPLGFHTIGLTASASFPNLENSFLFATYLNRQLRPTVGINGFTALPTAIAYGNEYLVDNVSGGEITFDWPLDIAVRPYTSTRLDLKLQYLSIEPANPNDFNSIPGLLNPQSGEKAAFRVSLTRKKLRPYSDNVVHPLDGIGFRAKLTLSEEILGSDVSYVMGDVSAYGVIPALAANRLFLYGKASMISGTPFNQDQVGFARFDDIQITAPEFGLLAFSDAVRVRGYRQFVYGNRLLFGTAEYRMPFIPSLHTTILGLISLRSTTISGFVDAGIVWQDSNVRSRRVGVGAELKNAVVIGGVLQLMHAVGIAQPASELGTSDNYEIYYRIRAALPF